MKPTFFSAQMATTYTTTSSVGSVPSLANSVIGATSGDSPSDPENITRPSNSVATTRLENFQFGSRSRWRRLAILLAGASLAAVGNDGPALQTSEDAGAKVSAGNLTKGSGILTPEQVKGLHWVVPDNDLLRERAVETLEPYLNRGNAVFINFWATWCTGCRKEFQQMNALATKYQDRGLVTISSTNEAKVDPSFVSLSGSPKVALHTFIGFGDSSGDSANIAQQFGVVSRPWVALISSEGEVVFSLPLLETDSPSLEQLDQRIGSYLRTHSSHWREDESPKSNIAENLRELTVADLNYFFDNIESASALKALSPAQLKEIDLYVNSENQELQRQALHRLYRIYERPDLNRDSKEALWNRYLTILERKEPTALLQSTLARVGVAITVMANEPSVRNESDRQKVAATLRKFLATCEDIQLQCTLERAIDELIHGILENPDTALARFASKSTSQSPRVENFKKIWQKKLLTIENMDEFFQMQDNEPLNLPSGEVNLDGLYLRGWAAWYASDKIRTFSEGPAKDKLIGKYIDKLLKEGALDRYYTLNLFTVLNAADPKRVVRDLNDDQAQALLLQVRNARSERDALYWAANVWGKLLEAKLAHP